MAGKDWRGPSPRSGMACRSNAAPCTSIGTCSPMRSSVCTKSSSDGSRRRRCCHQLRQPRCCFGRCSLPARSTCERLTVGGRFPKHPSVSQLTSQPDSVLSKCRRSRHPIPTQIATAPKKRPSFTLLEHELYALQAALTSYLGACEQEIANGATTLRSETDRISTNHRMG